MIKGLTIAAVFSALFFIADYLLSRVGIRTSQMSVWERTDLRIRALLPILCPILLLTTAIIVLFGLQLTSLVPAVVASEDRLPIIAASLLFLFFVLSYLLVVKWKGLWDRYTRYLGDPLYGKNFLVKQRLGDDMLSVHHHRVSEIVVEGHTYTGRLRTYEKEDYIRIDPLYEPKGEEEMLVPVNSFVTIPLRSIALIRSWKTVSDFEADRPSRMIVNFRTLRAEHDGEIQEIDSDQKVWNSLTGELLIRFETTKSGIWSILTTVEWSDGDTEERVLEELDVPAEIMGGASISKEAAAVEVFTSPSSITIEQFKEKWQEAATRSEDCWTMETSRMKVLAERLASGCSVECLFTNVHIQLWSR